MANRVLQWTPDEVARNGASLRINFGQRFSWAPLAFSNLADSSPPQVYVGSVQLVLTN